MKGVGKEQIVSSALPIAIMHSVHWDAKDIFHPPGRKVRWETRLREQQKRINAVDSGTPQTVFFILKVVHVGFAVKMRNPPSPFSCWCPKLIFWHHNCVANYVLIIFHACFYLLWNFAMKQPRPIRERARVLKTCVPIYTCTSHPSGIWTSVTIILF